MIDVLYNYLITFLFVPISVPVPLFCSPCVCYYYFLRLFVESVGLYSCLRLVHCYSILFVSFRIYEAVHERQGKNSKELTVEKGDILQVYMMLVLCNGIKVCLGNKI